MKRTYNKAIATLTLIIMTLTMLIPMSASAADSAPTFNKGKIRVLEVYPSILTNTKAVGEGDITFYETTPGKVMNSKNGTDSYEVKLAAGRVYDDSWLNGQAPSGLTVTLTKNASDNGVIIKVTGTASEHTETDSKSIEVTVKSKKLKVKHEYWDEYEDYREEKKTLAFIFDDGDPSKPELELNNKLSSDTKYEVTSMSLNKFISLRDEINGNYDIVYFGKGTYSKNSINEMTFGNDITGLRADKVLEFINSNQLCIFHEDVFKGSSEDDTLGNDEKGKPKIPATIIYQKFNPVRSKANVKVVSSADAAKDTIKNLYDAKTYNHRPILTVTDYPKSYRLGNKAVSHNLIFEYGVYDPDLKEDDYLTVELYIDRNSNSIYEANERITTRKILNGEYDTILYDMPSDYTGVFFWKLVVTDTVMDSTGSTPLGAKTEKVDVFHLKGDEITINVLQIKPNLDNNASLTDLFNTPVSGGAAGETLGYRKGEFNIIVTEATVKEFNDNSGNKHLRDLTTYYDMVILGFADNYSDDTEFKPEAITELQKFIDSKQSVMFTHDSIHFKYNTNLTTAFNDDVGQSLRGGNGETAGLIGFSGTDPKGDTIESNLHNNYSSLNSTYKLANYQTVNPYPDTANLVSPVNSNTITLYPYNLEAEAPSERKVAKTHYQWFKLDLEKSDVIPLFNLNKGISGERVNDDSMNNYYTYTDGNITYSGTGHADGYPEYEIKLFINTALKAHAIANKKPIIDLIEPTGNTVNKTTPTIPLSFKLSDDYDNQLDYWIDVDYNNDGVFERVIADKVSTPTDVLIDSYVLENRSSVGKFSIRIRAKEPRASGAESILIKEMECVNVPVFKPTVTFTNTANSPITAALIGETVKINTNISATGNITTGQKTINPKYDLDAKYLDGTQVISKTNKDTGVFTFHATNAPLPAGGYDIQDTVTINTAGATQLNVTAKAKHDAFGLPQEGKGTLIVNNGSVKIEVNDGVRKIKDVQISDGGSPLGKTNNAGTITLSKLTGNHQYSIKSEDIPIGYKLTPGSVTVKRLSDGVETSTDSIASVALTGEHYSWEVTFKLTLDLGINAKYYKLKGDGSNWAASYLGADGGNYYLRSAKGLSARYLTRIEIGTLSTLKIQGIKFELETLDKFGNPVAPADAASIIDDPVGLSGTIPAELNPANVKQLKADNGLAGLPASGTYAGRSYYLVIHMPNADLQRVKIKKATLTFEDGTSADYVPSSSIIFGEPATPLLR